MQRCYNTLFIDEFKNKIVRVRVYKTYIHEPTTLRQYQLNSTSTVR